MKLAKKEKSHPIHPILPTSKAMAPSHMTKTLLLNSK
jgi:hypothetical protein